MKLKHVCLSFGLIAFPAFISGKTAVQSAHPDSIAVFVEASDPSVAFYDSLRVRANRKKLFRLLYENIVTGHHQQSDGKSEAILYYQQAEGKTIRDITLLRLDVFGPSVLDTTIRAKTRIEQFGNTIHMRSDLKSLRKNLIVKPGDILKAEILYENERILRTMSRIKDARFLLIPDSVNNNVVDLLLLTQDRFSIGIAGVVESTSSARLQIYNSNFLGLGHEASVSLVGHLNKEPFLGFETGYDIANINGRFLNFSAAYFNTYRNEGAAIHLEKPLIRTNDKWGFGIHGYTFYRTGNLPEQALNIHNLQLRYNQMNGWISRNLQLGPLENPHSQLSLAFHYLNRKFSDKSVYPEGSGPFFSGTCLYLGGLTWSQRSYIPDLLIYGYGITEDIPKGFKYEAVMGYDDNMNGNRIYGHVFISNGNLLRNRPGYLYVYGGAGSFYRKGDPHQGQIEGGLNYISGLHGKANTRYRHFLKIDYIKGINRYYPENLYFEKNDLIRGFESNQISGKERVNVNFESVYFQKRSFYRFNVAFFTFLDLGILGDGNRSVMSERLYGGFGGGIRLHNESLVLKTIFLRLGIYPFPPRDMGLIGLLITEQTRQKFYSFQPGPPAPRIFE